MFSILAELLRPGTFSAIVAVDPTMFPQSMYMHAPLEDNPMAQITLKRRDTWKDRYVAKLVKVEDASSLLISAQISN